MFVFKFYYCRILTLYLIKNTLQLILIIIVFLQFTYLSFYNYLLISLLFIYYYSLLLFIKIKNGKLVSIK